MLYRWESSWHQVSGANSLKQVSVADASTMWAVNDPSNVFKLDTAASVWRQVPSSLNHMSAASDNTAV